MDPICMMLTCFRGALPPVLLRAVCLVRAMASFWFVDEHDEVIVSRFKMTL
jgi:hypothetical protein